MTDQELMSVYDTISHLTGEMVDAAQAHDWAKLAQLEVHCEKHIQQLKQKDTLSERVQVAQENKAHIIHKILADDKKIRDIIQPRMAHLSQLLQHAHTQQKIAKTYFAQGLQKRD